MRKITVMVFAIGLASVVVMGKTLEREPLVVEAQPLSPSVYGSGSGSVADLLGQIPEVDLQTQGVPGGQSDMSIRGSSFSGAGVALHGLSLPHAQTEHFHAELPFALEWFGSPRVLTGFEQSAASSGFLVGTVDMGVLPITTRRLLSGGISEYDSYWGQLLVQQQWAATERTWGVGAFAGGGDIKQVDVSDNDVRIRRAGAQLQLRNRHGDQTDLLVGRQEKTLGVRGYYGVNPAWAGEEDIEDTLIYLGTSRSRPGGDVRASAYYREFSDDYLLFWSLPGIFENNHRLDVLGGMLDGRWRFADGRWLDWRATASEERIRSSALGYHSRQQMAFSGIPGIRVGAWQYQLGARVDIFEEEQNEFLPQAAITYFTASGISVQLAYSESVRQPSYTELNYESPASLGNAGLDTQKASTTELLVRGGGPAGIDWKAGVFYRTTDDTVDWIRRTSDAARWEAENIDTVKTLGVEAGGRWLHSSGSSVAIQYLGLDQSDDSDLHASRYALDYAKHVLRALAQAALGTRITLGYRQTVRRQQANSLRDGGRNQYDGSIQATYLLRRYPEVLLLAAVDNVWDDDYQVFPGQETYVGRRASAGMRIEW